MGNILFFDTVSTGVPRDYQAPITDSSSWPRLVQLAWVMTTDKGRVIKKCSHIIKPDGFLIPSAVASSHGITTDKAMVEGEPLASVLREFMTDLDTASMVVCHNVSLAQHIIGAELYREGYATCNRIITIESACTMELGADICKGGPLWFGGDKKPKLQELYRTLFGLEMDSTHNAVAYVSAIKDSYFELCRRGVV